MHEISSGFIVYTDIWTSVYDSKTWSVPANLALAFVHIHNPYVELEWVDDEEMSVNSLKVSRDGSAKSTVARIGLVSN